MHIKLYFHIQLSLYQYPYVSILPINTHIPIFICIHSKYKKKFYDKKLAHALEMLNLEWSKNGDTKMQCNRLKPSPLRQGNAFNTKSLARVKQQMQGEMSINPLAVNDPLLLPEQELRVEIGIT